jgi:hypothetical protein
MSYELYPNLLEIENGSSNDLIDLARRLEAASTLQRFLKRMPKSNFRTFLARCGRSGLNSSHIASLLRQHAETDDFRSTRGRLRFVQRCGTTKMQHEGKRLWGVKCSPRFADYHSLWPQAYFLNMLRDGRDVLASQLHTGSFNKSPEEVARSWVRSQDAFRAFEERHDVRARDVRYEDLVQQPEAEVRSISEFLQLSFDPRMIHFYQEDLTIFSSSHLSMARISNPIDQQSVGRWKKDLSTEDLHRFEALAGPSMRRLGYNPAQLDRPC